MSGFLAFANLLGESEGWRFRISRTRMKPHMCPENALRKVRSTIQLTGPKPVGGWRGGRARIFGQGGVPQAQPVDTPTVVRKRAPQRSVLRGGGAPAVDADTKCRRSTPGETETTKPARGDGEAVTDRAGVSSESRTSGTKHAGQAQTTLVVKIGLRAQSVSPGVERRRTRRRRLARAVPSAGRPDPRAAVWP